MSSGSVPALTGDGAVRRAFAGLLALGLGLAGPAGAQQPMDPAARFARRVAAYEAADRTTPPPTMAILLAGDSQFDRWTTFRDDLAGYTVIRRQLVPGRQWLRMTDRGTLATRVDCGPR